MFYELMLAMFSGFALDVLVKATLLLTSVMLIDLCLRHGSAAMRHRIWATAFVGLLLLPVLSFVIPEYRLAILPADWFTGDPINATGHAKLSSMQFTQKPKLENSEASYGAATPLVKSFPRLDEAQLRPSISTLPEYEPSVESKWTPAPSIDGQNKTRKTSGWLQTIEMVGLVWSFGCFLAISPLILGIRRILLLQSKSPAVLDQEPTDTLAELCRRLKILRPVRLLETEQSIVPMTWGLLSPVVIVPASWRDWTTERRRLVLLHELAHVKRLDVVYQSIARVACSLYWFHPLAWYAIKRLRVERELACDDCVLMAGERPSQYAEQLLTIAREFHLMEMPPAVAMAQRSGLESRVRAMLDQARSHVPLNPGVAGGMLVASVVALLLLAPIRLGAITQPTVGAEAGAGSVDEAKAANGTQPELVNQKADEKYVFKGNVIHPDGTPAPGASLHWLYFEHGRLPDDSIPPVTTTDANGAFEIRGVPAGQAEFMELVATKAGFGVSTSKPAILFETTGKLVSESKKEMVQRVLGMFGNDKTLQLVSDDQPLSGRILTVEGKPVANAQIRVRDISTNPAGNLDAWEKATMDSKADYVSLRKAAPGRMNEFQLPSIVPDVLTDTNGKFTLVGVGRERIVQLTIGGPGIETSTVFARTRDGKTIRAPHHYGHQQSGHDIYYANGFDFVATPSVPVEGRIVDDSTGDPLTGFVVSGGDRSYITTVTDSEGRYKLSGLSQSNEDTLFVKPPRGSRYLPLGVRPKTKNARETVNLDFKLKPVALLRGRVLDKSTGKPISGFVDYFAMTKNPNLADNRAFAFSNYHRCITDKEGRYEIAVLAGEGVVTFRADDSLSYRRAAGKKTKIGDRFTTPSEMGMYETVPSFVIPGDYNFAQILQIGSDANDTDLPIELSPGNALNLKVVNADGAPVPNAIVQGKAETRGWSPMVDESSTIEGYYADQGREIFAYDPESHQAAHVQLTGPQSGEIVVKLQTAGTVRGRITDKQGVEVPSAHLLCDSIPAEFSSSSGLRRTTDKDGRFELRGVVADYKHTVWAMIEGRGMMAIARDVKVDPKTGLDLGDIVYEAK